VDMNHSIWPYYCSHATRQARSFTIAVARRQRRRSSWQPSVSWHR
jgi:hypothetical protein